MSDVGILVPLPSLIRIRGTGADRARFLHNFCTNDINGLAVGGWCEAFFTNVKARILAHGFVLADDDHHDIWMLPGDEQLLLDHLCRYVITEDVTFESITDAGGSAAVAGSLPLPSAQPADSTAARFTDLDLNGTSVRCLSTTWNGKPFHLLAATAIDSASLCSALISEVGQHQLQPGTPSDFDRLRIQARFPLIGRDLNDDHLAPEAGRNRSAVSFTKGCYLGQEPIARLDAMGQIRRVLAAVELQVASTESDLAADLTSLDDTQSPSIGLAVVSAESIRSRSAVVRTDDGQVCSASVIQPASLDGDEAS